MPRTLRNWVIGLGACDWQINRSMRVADRQAGNESYTNQSPISRAATLGWMVARSKRHENRVDSPGAQHTHFGDIASGAQSASAVFAPAVSQAHSRENFQ